MFNPQVEGRTQISVLSELLEKRDECQQKLDDLVASLRVTDEESGEERDREMDPDEEQRSKDLLEKRSKLDARIQEESESVARQNMLAEARRNAGVNVEARDSGADVRVVDEPKVYGHGSPHSYFADLYYTSGQTHSPMSPVYRSAFQRQMEWSNQVEHEVADGSKFGRFVEKQLRELYRHPGASGPSSAGNGPDWKEMVREIRSRGRVGLSDKGVPGVESRALTTGGGATASASGGGVAAFVTPIFTESDYVPFRELGRAFADETTKRPLPDYGMTINN